MDDLATAALVAGVLLAAFGLVVVLAAIGSTRLRRSCESAQDAGGGTVGRNWRCAKLAGPSGTGGTATVYPFLCEAHGVLVYAGRCPDCYRGEVGAGEPFAVAAEHGPSGTGHDTATPALTNPCPKCSPGLSVAVSYHPNRSCCNPHSRFTFSDKEGAHLHYTCRNCGYDWTGDVADA